MLVSSNLLFLKQIEKAPALTGAFLFAGNNQTQPLCLDEFSCNPFGMTILQRVKLRKLLNGRNLGF